MAAFFGAFFFAAGLDAGSPTVLEAAALTAVDGKLTFREIVAVGALLGVLLFLFELATAVGRLAVGAGAHHRVTDALTWFGRRTAVAIKLDGAVGNLGALACRDGCHQ